MFKKGLQMLENAKRILKTEPNYPILSPDIFNLNKDKFTNQLFYCPKCELHYCYGFDNGNMYCNDCFWTREVKDACQKRYGYLGVAPMMPLQKPCYSCLAKQKETIGYLLEKAAKKRKAKARKAQFRKPAKVRRLERRVEKIERQKRKKVAAAPFSEPIDAVEAAKTMKRNNSVSRAKTSIKKNIKRLQDRTGCISWRLSPSMRYAC